MRSFNDISSKEIRDNLAQPMYMYLLTVVLVLLGWHPAVMPIVMGVECVRINIHHMDEHPEDGWMRAPTWSFVGIVLALFGFWWLGAPLKNPWPWVTILGSQVFSYAIHQLAHEKWSRTRAFSQMAMGAFLSGAVLLI